MFMRNIALAALALTFTLSVNTAQAQESCGVTFHKYPDLRGMSATFFGPAHVADLDDLEYPNGEDLDNDVRSVGTLANTWIELYADENFKYPKYRLPPNTWRNVKGVESYRVTCTPPEGYDPEALK